MNKIGARGFFSQFRPSPRIPRPHSCTHLLTMMSQLTSRDYNDAQLACRLAEPTFARMSRSRSSYSSGYYSGSIQHVMHQCVVVVYRVGWGLDATVVAPRLIRSSYQSDKIFHCHCLGAQTSYLSNCRFWSAFQMMRGAWWKNTSKRGWRYRRCCSEYETCADQT